MLRIRLRRVGLKRQASYRIVVANSRDSRDGRYVEVIGFYNPRTEPETVEYKEDRALYWLNVGAQPSESVDRFFKRYGTMDRLARLRQGETMEALVADAEAARVAAGPVSPKTKYPAPKVSKAKAAAAAQDE